MKKIFLMTTLACLFAVSMLAQQGQRNDKPSKERIKSMRIAHITEQIQLTPEEAQNFWPVYNQYESRKKELKKTLKSRFKDKKAEDMTEQEAEDAVLAMIELQEKELNLKKELIRQLKGILSMKKIALLHKAERSFREKIIKRLNKNKARSNDERRHH